MSSKSYELVRQFLRKYPFTIAWRNKQHCKIIDEHLNPEEKLLYVFVGQKNDRSIDIFNTNVVAFTNKRIMVATKRVLFGYFFKSITPDMYNDCTVKSGIIWGTIGIDTIKETAWISNLSKKALPEIETIITTFMQEMKKKYPDRDDD